MKFQWKKAAAQKWLATGLVCAGLTACGGGGGNVGPAAPEAQTGVFIDSPVAGLAYRTESRSGVTNSAGEFEYLAGETVSFSLGSMPLGEVSGAAEVTVFDLFGVAELPANADQLWERITEEADDRPLHTAINLGALLQTLDADADPENGINIASAVAARFDENTLRLDQPYYRFEANHRLREILRAAVDAGELAARPQVRGSVAFAHLLEQAGIDATISYARRIETDTDGIEGAERVLTRQFAEAFGRVTSNVQDYDGDGSPDHIISYTYDSGGRLATYAIDPDGDGTPTETHTYEYTEFGDLAYRENRNAAGDVIYSDRRTYDGTGNMVARSVFNANGNSTRQRWTVNADGVRTGYDLDEDADGIWDRHDDLVYDDQDRWIERSIDSDNDGIVDEYHTRRWNALGQMTYESKDTDNDGNIDILTTRTYDEGGLQLEYALTYPSAADQSNASRQLFTYDSEGRMIRNTLDRGDDETIDRVRTWSFSTNAQGLEVTEESNDWDGDGLIDYRTVAEKNGADQLVRRTVYTADGSGNETAVTTEYTYDAQGRLLSTTDGTNTTTYSDFVDVSLGLAI